MEIDLSTADITTVPADAIVNAAHHALRGGGGVDGAIHRAGGPAILAELHRALSDGIPTGQAGWTTAGKLPATVRDSRRRAELHSGATGSGAAGVRATAMRCGSRTNWAYGVLRLPAVSAGIYGWPAQSAADIAVRTLLGTATGVAEAAFCLVEPRLYKAFGKALEKAERGGR